MRISRVYAGENSTCSNSLFPMDPPLIPGEEEKIAPLGEVRHSLCVKNKIVMSW